MKKITQPDPPKEVGWYKPENKPVNAPGVFRTRGKGIGVGFSYFSGNQWGNQQSNADRALVAWMLYGASGLQEKEWCGLAVAVK